MGDEAVLFHFPLKIFCTLTIAAHWGSGAFMLLIGSPPFNGVAVGTANFRNPYAMPEIIGGLEKYMEENGIRDLKEISRCYRNAKRVFFTGANPFVLSFDKLKTLAELVRKYYPRVQSIGCFARITDITPRTTEQLRELGYNSLTIGVEAGDEESLSFMHKGARRRS